MPPSDSAKLEALIADLGWARSVALSLSTDSNDADDLLQDAVLAALKCGPQAGTTRSWLRAVLVNGARMRHRSLYRRQARERQVASPELTHASVEAAIETREARVALLSAVAHLPVDDRELIRLRYVEDLDSGVIAERLQITPSGARMRLKRALERLRSELDRRTRRSVAPVAGAAVLAPLASAATALLAATLTVVLATQPVPHAVIADSELRALREALHAQVDAANRAVNANEHLLDKLRSRHEQWNTQCSRLMQREQRTRLALVQSLKPVWRARLAASGDLAPFCA